MLKDNLKRKKKCKIMCSNENFCVARDKKKCDETISSSPLTLPALKKNTKKQLNKEKKVRDKRKKKNSLIRVDLSCSPL